MPRVYIMARTAKFENWSPLSDNTKAVFAGVLKIQTNPSSFGEGKKTNQNTSTAAAKRWWHHVYTIIIRGTDNCTLLNTAFNGAALAFKTQVPVHLDIV